jgi:hypothetical protein
LTIESIDNNDPNSRLGLSTRFRATRGTLMRRRCTCDKRHGSKLLRQVKLAYVPLQRR